MQTIINRFSPVKLKIFSSLCVKTQQSLCTAMKNDYMFFIS